MPTRLPETAHADSAPGSSSKPRTSRKPLVKEASREISLPVFCQIIDVQPWLRTVLIMSTSVHVERRVSLAPHRCLVLHLRKESREDIWLRIGRPTLRGGWSLLRKSNDTSAYDVV
jgi:hypothetical protein